jgi:hypothetical protein
MTMPDQPQALQNPAIDKEQLRQKYLEERNKRLRPDGNDQYLRVAGQLAHYLDDPYTPVTPRQPKTDHVTLRLYRRRLCRARHRRAAFRSRRQGCQDHREGRRPNDRFARLHARLLQHEGREPGPAAKLNVGHPAGPVAYFKYIDGWRNSGQFEGLQFR